MTVHTVVRDIPLAKAVASPHNVRRTSREAGIEELAASIAAHGVLQNLVVRPVPNAKRSAEDFEVIADGRRLAAMALLVKRKQWKKTAAVPCIVRDGDDVEETSLAENVVREALHPADQYESFRRLHDDHGLGVEAIAARFGVTPHVVKQRLKLGTVSSAGRQSSRWSELAARTTAATGAQPAHPSIGRRRYVQYAHRQRSRSRRLIQPPRPLRRPRSFSAMVVNRDYAPRPNRWNYLRPRPLPRVLWRIEFCSSARRSLSLGTVSS